MKHIAIIFVASVIAAGCTSKPQYANTNDADSTLVEQKTYSYTRIPESSLNIEHKEYDGNSVITHKEYTLKNPGNGFGVAYHQKDKDGHLYKFCTLLTASKKGASEIIGFKAIIGDDTYECCFTASKKIRDGRIVAIKNHAYDIADFVEPLANADSAKVLIIFDNGEKEVRFTKDDLKIYHDMVGTYISNGGTLEL